MATKIRVMIVEGDPVLRQGMARLLGLHPMIEVVASALSGRTALPKLDSYRPDCVVLNLASAGDEAVPLLGQLPNAVGSPYGIVIAPIAVAADVVAGVESIGSCTVVRGEAVGASEPGVATLVQQLLPAILRRSRAPARAVPATGPAASGASVEAAVAAPARPKQDVVGGPATGAQVPLRPPAASPATLPAPAAMPVATMPAAPAGAPAPAAPPVPGGALGGVGIAPARPAAPQVAPPLALHRLGGAGPKPKVVGIGVSTGGPKALAEVLPRLPADFPVPIVLVQHMPPKFTASLAESLDRSCRLRVREAQDGDRLERGRILIAPGGFHLRVVGGDGGEVVRLTEDPPECSCRPSVDYLFRSLVESFGGKVLGVVLTGMGEDGWAGSRLIHGAGGRVLAQHETSCTVYGMPRGPIESGAAQAVALDQMADAIVQLTRGAPCS